MGSVFYDILHLVPDIIDRQLKTGQAALTAKEMRMGDFYSLTYGT